MSPLHDLSGPLHMHFIAARRAYGDYLANSRRFLFARNLRRINVSARALLLGRGYLLPPALQEDAAALIAHYDVWLTLWSEHRLKTRPTLDDPFVFENEFTYPKAAEARLEAHYAELCSGAAGRSGRAQPAQSTA